MDMESFQTINNSYCLKCLNPYLTCNPYIISKPIIVTHAFKSIKESIIQKETMFL